MNRTLSHRLALVAAASIAGVVGVAGLATTASAEHARNDVREHTVYTSTNSAAGNQVLSLRSAHGSLVQVASTSTGGLGSGSGLGSEGAVVVDGDHLFVVDAGSNDVAAFRLDDHGMPHLLGRASSGGTTPVSVTVHDDVVYVLNAGDETVSGLRLDNGHLTAIAGSHQQLSGAAGAEIAFGPGGGELVVTEKGTNTLEVLPVRDDRAQAPTSYASTGATPFGFAIDRRGHVVVTNAAGGAPGASSVSSYQAHRDGGLDAISAAVPTTQTAACWLTLSVDQRTAYDTNAGSNTISSYSIAPDGSLTLLQAVAATPGIHPVDLIATRDSLFTLNTGSNTVAVDAIQDDATLVPVTTANVPAGATGLAAR